jgi:hypothetical protein
MGPAPFCLTISAKIAKRETHGMLPLSTHLFSRWSKPLKVPKREIFDSSDFPDFYTIKSLRVGDFGVKINKKFKNI